MQLVFGAWRIDDIENKSKSVMCIGGWEYEGLYLERTTYPMITAHVEDKCEEGQWRWG